MKLIGFTQPAQGQKLLLRDDQRCGAKKNASVPMMSAIPAVHAIAGKEQRQQRIYHCGNFLGIWAQGGGWYCRKCKKVIELLLNQWEIDSEASAGAQ